MANFVSYANATDLMTEIGNKIKALNGAYIFRGSVAFANLPSNLTASMVGYVYNVTDDFTTTADFIEGAGKKYPAGTNVAIANVGTSLSPDMKFDANGSFYDVDEIEDRIDDTQAMLAPEFDATSAYAIGDIVTYQDGIYKFKAAHTANDPWDATEVDAVTIASLVSSAEPDSLTQAQINALIALL